MFTKRLNHRRRPRYRYYVAYLSNMKIILLTASLCLLTLLQAQTPAYNYYFGNLHSHTGYSDGCQDSATSGITEPAGAYNFAKASQHFDFLGISEHNHYSASKNPGFKQPLYQPGLTIANNANQDNVFLTLFGVEYGVSSNYNGHVVVYGFNQLLGWETGVPGVSGNNYDIFNAKTDYDGLWRKVKNNPNAFCYVAHPNNTDYTTNGLVATALYNAPYNAAYDSAIVGVPLRNGPAFSTSVNYTDYSSSNYFAYYKKLLSIGYHVGMTYDHDNHNTTFGRPNAGRLVILAPSLTRPNLYYAMQNMHFYGSDDWNAKIDFNTGGNIMGSILTGSVAPTFNVVHNDDDGEHLNYLQIWRGVSGSGSLPTVVYTSYQNNTATYTEQSMIQGTQYYYFAELKQADGNWIITSPIWYTSTQNIGPVTSVQEHFNDIKFNFFPNPVSKQLNISIAECDNYTVSITDISGRTVLKNTYNDRELSIDLAGIQAGVYMLNVSTGNSSVSKKLIVE